MNSGFPGSEEWSREKNSVDKVSVLQQQILTLTEEVKSQKVSVVKRLISKGQGPDDGHRDSLTHWCGRSTEQH